MDGGPDRFHRAKQMSIVEMGIAGCGLDTSMPKKLADHGQALPTHGRMTGKGMAQVMKSEIPEAGRIAELDPRGSNTEEWFS